MKRPKSALTKVGEYSALAFLLPSATAVGYILGVYADRALGTNYLYLVFTLLGIAAGIIKLLQQLQKDLRNGNGS
jgi:F0F1-type ATP synthase assembly protein I